MNYVQDIGVNLVATGAAFCCGLIFRTVIHEARSRRARRFWGRHAKGDTNLFLGTFVRDLQFEPTGLIGLGDAHAAQELTGLFADLGIGFTMSYTSRVLEGQTRSNLVLLGGAEVNEIADAIMTRLHTGFIFTPAPMTLTDMRQNRQFVAQWRANGEEVESDHGLLIRTRNPFNPERTVVIIAGVYGFGTWAGVRLVRDPAFVRRCRSLGDFVCVYKTEVLQGFPHHVTPVYNRRLVHGSGNPECPIDCSLRAS